MDATQKHLLDCLVQHYAATLRSHLDALHGIRGTLERRQYIDAVARKEGAAVGEALRHAFADEWQQRRARVSAGGEA